VSELQNKKRLIGGVIMKPETITLVKEIQLKLKNRSNINVYDGSYTNEIKAIIEKLEKERKEVLLDEKPTYTQQINNLYFSLTQEPYYQTHYFNDSDGDPQFLKDLEVLFNVDDRVEFKRQVIVTLANTLLTNASTPSIKQMEDLKKVKSQISSLIVNSDQHILDALVKEIDALIEVKAVNYGSLTEGYNQLTLEKIATYGITSSHEAAQRGFCLSSADTNLSYAFSCNAVNLDPKLKPQLDFILNYLTENELAGVYYIPMERSYKDNLSIDQAIVELQNRVQASIIFALNPLNSEYSLTNGVCWEQRIAKTLSSDYIQAIIVPSRLAKLAKQYFPNVPNIIEVEMMSKTLQPDDLVLDSLPSLKLHRQDEYELTVPNYRQGIQKYIETVKPENEEKFMLHITRLATYCDLKKLWEEKKLTQRAKSELLAKTDLLKRNNKASVISFTPLFEIKIPSKIPAAYDKKETRKRHTV